MNYEQTIDYLYTRLPMFSRIGPAALRPDLHNTIRLCNFLGNPQNKFKSIHVAGTNGKGSVSHMLASILQTAGYKTGLYTSPHLYDFRERIKTSNKSSSILEMVEPDFVIRFTEKIIPLIDELDPSFFEITVAMAFDYFASTGIEVAVIEVGLGGRLDSTNVITPELSVITNIGWDHMALLGDTLEKIASEKAGIIKDHIPVVIGEWQNETAAVFERTAAEKKAPLRFASKIRQVMEWTWKKGQLIVELAEEHQTDHKVFQLDLLGVYQKKNLVTVLEACYQLQQLGWHITHNNISKGLEHVIKTSGLQGRWEIIHLSPTIALDVAHNVDGIRQLLQQLELTDHRELHIVFGLVKDKEVEKILALLPKQATYYFTRAQIPRAMPEDELAGKAHSSGLKGRCWSNVNEALEAAKDAAHRDDLIVVCGSVFLVGEVKKEKFSHQ